MGCLRDRRNGAVCAQIHLHGGPAPVRRFPPELIDLVFDQRIRTLANCST
jgi:hypothetical protein